MRILMKLPINPLLYLLSVSSVGGIGLTIYDSLHPALAYTKKTAEGNKTFEKIRETFETRMKEGAKKQGDDKSWRYDGSPYWEKFRYVNLTGYVKPEEVEPVEPGETPPELEPIIDLNEVLQVICISHGGAQSGLVLNYRTSVNVPARFKAAASKTPGFASTIPPGRANQHGRPAMPRAAEESFGGAPPQHLKLDPKMNALLNGPKGDGVVETLAPTLWPPYADVHLVEVAEDAVSVTFEIRRKKNEDGRWPRQEVLKNELDLPPDILEKLSRGRHAKSERKGARSVKRPEPSYESGWRPVEETVVEGNIIIISNKTEKSFRQDGHRYLSEDIHMQDYSGGSGSSKVRGVQVRRLSRRARNLGVAEGDVLISLNGQPVKGRANAIRVGRRLYKQGVRSYRAEFLRRGQIIVLTYHLKK